MVGNELGTQLVHFGSISASYFADGELKHNRTPFLLSLLDLPATLGGRAARATAVLLFSAFMENAEVDGGEELSERTRWSRI